MVVKAVLGRGLFDPVCARLSAVAPWCRGIDSLADRQAPRRFVGVPAAIAASGLLVSVVTGSWLFTR